MTTKTDAMLERLEAVLAQLEELGLAAPPGVPVQHLDAYGNPGMVAPGELIESAWGNSVTGRVLLRFPNGTAMRATSVPARTIAYTSDNGVWWVYRVAAGWSPLPFGTTPSFKVYGTAAGQSIPVSTLTQAAWSDASGGDPHSIVDSTGAFMCPAQYSGYWAFQWAVEFPAGVGSRSVYCEIPGGRLAETSAVPSMETQCRMSGYGEVFLAEGQTARIMLWQTHTGPLTVNTSTTNQYFAGRYVGP